MSKIQNLEAVAADFSITVSELIDAIHSIGIIRKVDSDTLEIIDNRIKQADHVNLSEDYINGLRDARKLISGTPSNDTGEH